MQIYKTKTARLPGTEFKEVHKKAFAIYHQIKARSKRRPYIALQKKQFEFIAGFPRG